MTGLVFALTSTGHAVACDTYVMNNEGLSYPANVETDCEVEVFDIDDIVYTFVEFDDGQCWYVD
jgi:hypothetical protein